MDAGQQRASAGRMDRADQSVTRHAAASRAAYETLYAAFAAQPGGIRDSHRGVLEALRAELRLDQAFAEGVTARHDSKRQRSLRGSSSTGGGQAGEEKSGGGDGSDAPGIQIEWREVRARDQGSIWVEDKRLGFFENEEGEVSFFCCCWSAWREGRGKWRMAQVVTAGGRAP